MIAGCLLAAGALPVWGQSGAPTLVIRIDDLGALHSVNEACIQTYRSGIARSVEVMPVAAWYPEAIKMLKEKQKFKEIHDSDVIFITKNDYMKIGLPMYHVERTVQEAGTLFRDGSHIIYMNGSYKDDSDPVGKLIHDFRCTSSVDMFYQELANPVRHFKETEGGRNQVCEAMEEYGKRIAIKEKEESALKMIAKGKLTFEEIAEYLELSVERVEELANLQPV